jgi:hypothetical protein
MTTTKLALLLSLALGSLACTPGPSVRPAPLLPRTPPREIVVRTTSFRFHMGARVDETWPVRAEETRAALGQLLPVLLEEEDTTVPVLAKELGVAWPDDPVDFDARLGPGAAPCDPKMARVLDVSGGRARMFFACVLERAFMRLAPESAAYRGVESGSAGEPQAERLYACIVTVAVSTVLVARADDKEDARGVERGLAEGCDPRALDWVAREWIKRVREEETADAFGARAARALADPSTAPR